MVRKIAHHGELCIIFLISLKEFQKYFLNFLFMAASAKKTGAKAKSSAKKSKVAKKPAKKVAKKKAPAKKATKAKAKKR